MFTVGTSYCLDTYVLQEMSMWYEGFYMRGRVALKDAERKPHHFSLKCSRVDDDCPKEVVVKHKSTSTVFSGSLAHLP